MTLKLFLPRPATLLLFLFFSFSALFASEPLRVLQCREAWRNTFQIGFSSSIPNNLSNQELKKWFSVSPEVQFRVSGYDERIYLDCSKTQPGTCYRITVKAGFPGGGNVLPQDVTIPVMTSDADSEMTAASRGTFFPLHAPIWELPFNAINIDGEVEIDVSVPYENRIVDCLLEGHSSLQMHHFSGCKLKLSTQRNQRTGFAIDLAQAGIPRGKPGIYFMNISYPYTYGNYSYQRNADSLVVITDLALFIAASGSECVAQVRRLSAPEQCVPNAEIQLISQKKQLLFSGRTDAEGRCRFTIPKLQDRSDYPSLLLARNLQDGDLAYINVGYNFQSNESGAADIGAAVFNDRGIARPGEKIQSVVSLRKNSDGAAIKGMPVDIVLVNMLGVELGRQSRTTDDCGLAEALFDIPANAALGPHTVIALASGAQTEPEYCRSSFIVGDFTPDSVEGRLEMSLEDYALKYNGHAAYYFGQPVVGGAINLSLTSHWSNFIPPKAYSGYHFGCDCKATPLDMLTATATCDINGDFNGAFNLNDLGLNPEKYPGVPVSLMLQAELRNLPGIRPITFRKEMTFNYMDRYIGMQISETPDADGSRRISLLALTPQGEPTALPAELTCNIYMRNWHYLLKENSDGTFRREWQRIDDLVEEISIQPDANGQFQLTPPGNGCFVAEILDGEDQRVLCRDEFWQWEGESATRSANPTVLDFKLNQETYLPGDTAQISFSSSFEGMALVVAGTCGSQMSTFEQTINAGNNTFAIQIPKDTTRGRWFAAVTAVGKMTTDETGKPIDAEHLFGIAELKVKQDNHRLNIELTAPELRRPGQETEVTVALTDAEGNPVNGEVVLWAVDEGILALTAYRTPDLHDTFFGKLPCPIQCSDIYPSLYPLLRVVNGKIGGGYAADSLASKMAPMDKFRRERLGEAPPEGVIRLGIVKTDADGKTTVKFNAPDDAGALRIMAVAANANATGSAECRITIRAAVTVQCLAPQIAAPADHFKLQTVVFNHDAPSGIFKWQCSCGNNVTIDGDASGELQIASGEQEAFTIDVTIPSDAEEGADTITVKVTDAEGNEYLSPKCIMQIRSAAAHLPESTIDTLAPGESRRYVFAKGEHGTIAVGSPMLALRRHWNWLNDYPYGCLEQTVAAAFPQLAVTGMVKLGLLPEDFGAAAQMKVNHALSRLATMRCGDWYSMWPNGTYAWEDGSLFAFLFELEAERNGYELPAGEKRRVANVLRKYLNDRSKPAFERALATYALSLAAPELTAEYVKMLPLDEISPRQDYIRFMAAMALIRGGFAAEGATLRRKANLSFGTSCTSSENPLDKPARCIGLSLWLLADLLPEDNDITRLAAELQRIDADDSGWFTTNEHAWTVLGLSQYMLARHIGTLNDGQSIENNVRYAAVLEMQAAGADSAAVREWEYNGVGALKPCRLDDFTGAVLVRNTGDAELLIDSSRRVEQPRTQLCSGLAVTREFYSAAGLPVEECVLGDILEVRITATGNSVNDLVICDLLPGGFEIEDPNLVTRTVVPTPNSEFGKQKNFHAKLIERRYDRCLAFGDFDGSVEPVEILRYHVRATAAGRYSVPQAQAEAMYDPHCIALSNVQEQPFVVHAFPPPPPESSNNVQSQQEQ